MNYNEPVEILHIMEDRWSGHADRVVRPERESDK